MPLDLLVELGTEEIPASYLDKAIPELSKLVSAGLTALGLAPAKVEGLGTPRRITVWAGGVPERQQDVNEERTGPAEAAAYKDGKPTVAAEKFAESMGVSVSQLELREVTKGKKTAKYVWAQRKVVGRPTLDLLAEQLPQWIEKIPFKKTMRWVPGSRTAFARPVRRIVALLGGEVVPVRWAGLVAGRDTQGHRFLDASPIELRDASLSTYVEQLRAAHVLVRPEERRAAVERGLREHLGEEGLAARQGLVSEVTNLVEWPLVDLARFDERFLRLPRLVVEEAMMGHQRYFPIGDAEGLQPRFAYVANRPFDPVIRAGNERVLAARLHDALFFFEHDQETPLDQRVDGLDEIQFMPGLGSIKARIARIDALALAVAQAAGWVPAGERSPGTGTKVTRSHGQLALHLHLAATLARTDLTTDVVGEFPALQGEMGAIYARLQGQPEEVAVAIRESYLPRGQGGALPASKTGICLSIADKLDTIVCAYAIGKGPTGSQDQFQVRRSTLGILRILRERGVDCGYAPLVRAAVAALPQEMRGPIDGEPIEDVILAYFHDRLEVMATEAGFAHDHVRAVLASGKDRTNVVDAWARIEALSTLAQDPGFKSLFELVERTRTITRKNGPDVDPQDVVVAALDHPAEQALHAALGRCHDAVRGHVDDRRYVEAGRLYAETLAKTVHTFFEPAPTGVFVMDEDRRKRTNRLALLKQVHALLADGFADLAEVAGKA